MKVLWLCLPGMLYACTPSADNLNNNPQLALTEGKSEDGPIDPAAVDGIESPAKPAANDPVTPTPEDSPDPCRGLVPGRTDHFMNVTRDAEGSLVIDFKDPADRSLRVVSLYVTAVGDSLPIFPDFSFSGTAYWMVTLDDPFETYFQLPLTYAQVPAIGQDVTDIYKGLKGGARLTNLTQPTCVQASVITFEPDEPEAFKTSLFLLSYRPKEN